MTQTSPLRLERPLQDRKVSGVCAAIARHQRIDVTLVRAITIVLMAAGGIGFVGYFVGLLLIPSEGAAEPLVREGIDGPERNKVILLGIAAVISVFGFGSGPFGFFGFAHDTPWPVIAVALLVGAVVLAMRRDRGRDDEPSAPTSPTTPAAATTTTSVVPYAAGEAPTAVMAPVPKPRRERNVGRSLMILGATLIALAAAGGILVASGNGVRWDIALCAGAIAIGVVLVAASPFGGARILAPIGVLLALLAGTAAAANLDLRGGVGDHLVRPVALTAGDHSYHLAAGRLMVDLKDATLPAGQLTTVHAEVGFGQLVVRVPRDTVVQVTGHASAGDVVLYGHDVNGFDAQRSEITHPPGAAPTLAIDAHTGFGQVQVIGPAERLPKPGEHTHFDKGAGL